MSFDLVAATAYLTCGALMLFLGFVVLRENPGQRVNRATAGMLVFGGLGPILGAYASLAGRPDAADAPFDVFTRFAFLWEFFFPAVLAFSLVFPVQHRVLVRWPRLFYLLFVPHLFHVFLVLVGEDLTRLLARFDAAAVVPIGEGVVDRATGLLRVALELLLRIHVRFFSFVNLALALASWTILMRAAQRTANPKLRSQVRTIRFGLGLSLALYSGGALVPAALGLTPGRSIGLALVTVSLLVGAASILLAIVRLGFLDVRFIVRRGLVYGLASGVIVAAYLFVGKQIDRFSAQLVGEQLPVFETTFLVLSLFLLQPVLTGIERMVDRTHARDRTDLRNSLMRLSERVALMLEPADVTEAAATTMRREMVLDRVAVATHDRLTAAYRLTLAADEGGSESVTVEPHWRPGALVFEVMASRREPIAASELADVPRDGESRERLAAALAAIGAQVVLPLRAAAPGADAEGGALVGVLTLGRKVTETRLPYEELSLVSLVAHQIGISLMNAWLHKEQMAARLFAEEIATAREIQRQLLPESPPCLPGWELFASNSPSRHVGGDYHDFVPLPTGSMGIAIGDVSGKGVPAALLMANLQAALRGRVFGGQPPDRVVQDVNRQICRNTRPESFISFFLGELRPDAGKLSFTNAGHNAPVLVRTDGSVETLEQGGLLLGVFPEASYETGEVELGPGDFVAFYTDGVTEAANPEGELFSEERFVETLVKHRDSSAEVMHERVLQEVERFQQGRSPDDDLTLIVLRRVPNGAGG
jgi:sigma-B regulation protein RsbU (phosphoserine phosphatase)